WALLIRDGPRLAGLDWKVVAIAPFFPRAVVDLDVGVAGQPQGERAVSSTDRALAVGNHALIWLDTGRFIAGPNPIKRNEIAIAAPVEVVLPERMDGAGDAAASLGAGLFAGELGPTAHVHDGRAGLAPRRVHLLRRHE